MQTIKLDIMFSIYRYKGRIVSILPISEIYDEVDHPLNFTIDERNELLPWATKFQKSKSYSKLSKTHQELINDLSYYNQPSISGEVQHLPSLGKLIHSTETKNITLEF